MNDRIDTTIPTGEGASDADDRIDDRIDALARSAGSALRRPASADQLVRIHRAKRNQQIARAAGAAAAVLAVVGGAVVLMQRNSDEQLVPATVPTTLPSITPVTVEPTVPPTVSTPVSTPVTTPVSTPVSTPVTTPLSTSPPVNTATGEQPTVVYVGTQTTGNDQQQVIDLATNQVMTTEPMVTDPAITANPLRPEPRTTSAVNAVGYTLDLDDYDGCGQYLLTATGFDGTSALPARASLVRLSADGRSMVTMSAPDCPVPQVLEPGTAIGSVAQQHVQEIRLFDADDPSAEGRVLGTVRMLGNDAIQAEFSADGRFVLVNIVTPVDATQPPVVAYDIETGNEIVLDDGDCRFVPTFNRGPSYFVGEQSVVALTEKCDDGWHVEITSLYEPGNTAEWIVPDVTVDEVVAVEVEVWEQSLTSVGEATFTVSVSQGPDPAASRVMLRRAGGDLEILPYEGTIISFLPLIDYTGS